MPCGNLFRFEGSILLCCLDSVCRLENALRNFACLTTGDVIAINYNEKVSVSAFRMLGPSQP